MTIIKYGFILAAFFLTSCDRDQEQLYRLKGKEIGIDFENTLHYTESFNPYTYRNFFNGGGVALGDINNDGLIDIYFTGNIVDNKLYLNKGNWSFEDITLKAGVHCPNVWSTGATFADVNGDGWLDLYVCKSGKPGGANRHNELFINNGDLTFTEQSKAYGLDVEGLSVQAAFFDADADGDLDCYVLNNSLRPVGGYDLIKDQRNIPDPDGEGNKFFENKNGHFKDVTLENNMYASAIGFGLGITLSDFNNDRKTDIFISNDFFERDYLYYNVENGFEEVLEDKFESISLGSMGADAADLDNDLRPDLLVTEMLPKTLSRQKTKAKFDSWDKYSRALNNGYFHQYPRNTLQRNMGSAGFLELSRMSGVAATEWSWASLIFDMDNDGLKDIFIANGIYKDLLDRDYLAYMANDQNVKAIIKEREDPIKELIDIMPSKAVPNAAFKNKGDFNFREVTSGWGFEAATFSNGNAYGDLDNDGDLDLVINNVNMSAFIYENTLDTLHNRSLNLQFKGLGKNTFGVGSKVIIKYGKHKKAISEQYPSRGFQSSISNRIHFGVGNEKVIDSVIVLWPNGMNSLYLELSTNQNHSIKQPEHSNFEWNQKEEVKSVEKRESTIQFTHKENQWIDFNRERLIPQMFNNEGPALATADVNGDGVQDVYVGGAKNQSGSLFLSSKTTSYTEQTQPFIADKGAEDTDAVFFDGDQDGDLDLYITSGGKAFSIYANELNDRYYINDGKGNFVKNTTAFTYEDRFSSSTVSTLDYNNDGRMDLFVGERFGVQLYGLKGSGYLFINQGNNRFIKSEQALFENIGMITDSKVVDIDKDGWQDLLLVGNWMPISLFINQQGKTFKNSSREYGLEATNGLWNTVEVADINADGILDILAGNLGNNTFFESGMRMYINDFDQNGSYEQIICKPENGRYYPIVDKDELIAQLPQLKKKIVYYKDYGAAAMQNLFSQEALEKSWIYQLDTTATSLFLGQEQNVFQKVKLPAEIQYSSVYAIHCLKGDEKNRSLYFGGNQYLVKPQFGRYDASKGWELTYKIKKGTPLWNAPKSMNIKGQIRAIKPLKTEQQNILLVGLNNASLYQYEIEK